ncbi:hypothetical protein GON01_01505 [Sphingomonas sp. MAH-20]|uniref:Autotransporter domain-containing protein n=1 Tax=Sphingomonas horti TaxID=2682842 RepID=A0A6I4IXC6_9SPHN|nr:MULTISPECIES: hypothetical protein [Sphingomonas]MBA2920364.1 hypothetical protein [Sphingomonas sp. CGMCC 1.13658]MVO76618.1 hypothetical protein [Sphingomonas horti]
MLVRLGLGMVMACTAATAARATGPDLTLDVSSNDRVGLNISGKARTRVSAAVGLWSDDGAVEFGGFQDRMDPAMARAAELVSGRPMRSRGLRLGGSLYEAGPEARGWSVGVEARQQWTTDVGAALAGSWRTASDSRLSVSGKLRF